MLHNLAWATGYNLVAIPLAAGVAYGVGVILNPAVGAAFMALSTIIVAINARSLRVEKRTRRQPACQYFRTSWCQPYAGMKDY